MTKAIALWCITILCIFLPGCDETGDSMDSPGIGTLVFKTYVIDPLSFEIYINGDLIREKKQFKYYDGTIQLKIVEAVSGRLIFDDDYAVHPFGGTQVAVTVHQSKSGSLPVCLLSPADAPAPPAGYGKVAILYNFPDYPDSLKAVIENTTTATSAAYMPTDSLIVKRNAISLFFLSRSGARKAQVKLYTASGDRKHVATIDGTTFSDMGHGFSIYVASSKDGSGIHHLIMERIY